MTLFRSVTHLPRGPAATWAPFEATFYAAGPALAPAEAFCATRRQGAAAFVATRLRMLRQIEGKKKLQEKLNE